MGFLGWMKEHFLEILMYIDIFMLIMIVISGLFSLDPEMKPQYTIMALLLLLVLFVIIGLIALTNRLQFKMGFRNLIRHRGDTVIAILGFMIGTSIICSSMAIGDTMDDMIESLVYDAYDLTDEYIHFRDGNGDLVYINGTLANNMSDIAWAVNENRTLVDGVSWEVQESGAVFNRNSFLFEPRLTLRAFSRSSVNPFGGLYVDGEEVDYNLAPDEVYVVKRGAEKLEAEEGHILTIYSKGGYANFTVKGVLDQTGRANTFEGESIYFNFHSLWGLLNITPEVNRSYGDDRDWSGGLYNILYISNEGGRVDGGELCPEVMEKLEDDFQELPHPLGENDTFEFTDDKKTSVDSSIEGMSQFSQMFLLLGTFTIIAGITLIINIFVMLSEERKGEMGISRAVGMKRRHLRLVYLFEGTLYSIFSSLVGVAMGVATGYGIIYGLQSIMNSMGFSQFDILTHYNVTYLSLVLSFVAGFTITITTTVFITQRIAKLNIVSAIRNTPIPIKRSSMLRAVQKRFGAYDESCGCGDGSARSRTLEYLMDKMTITGTAIIFIGILLLFHGLSSKQFWSTYMGLSLPLIGLSLLLRYFVSERITFNIAAILILILWSAPDGGLFDDFSGDIEMFLLTGLFMVSAGVLLLVWNTDIILWIVEKIVCAVGISPASFKMAISYPVKKRFRTGVTIFMFALIIFTITTMSMIVEMFNVNIDQFEESLGGGYDIIGYSGLGIDDLEQTVRMSESNPSFQVEVADKIGWDGTVSLSMGLLRMNFTNQFHGETGEEEGVYQCAGVSDRFIERNTYGFSDVKWDLIDSNGSREHTDSLVWESLENPDFVILDASQGGSQGFGPPGGDFKEVGDRITLKSIDGENHTKTIIGYTEQFGISAVFMREDTASDEFGVTEKTIHLIKVKDNHNKGDVANDMKRSLLRYMFSTIIIEDFVEDILKAQNSFFDLFNAFLSLGLVIGIVGLGIVTLRSVYERRHEIGMMRAVGFKRRAVVGTFLGESSFIAGSGLLIGTLLGILLGWIMWRDDMKEAFPEFGIPWVKLLTIVGIAFLFAIISTIPPSLKASKVTPAEALRYD